MPGNRENPLVPLDQLTEFIDEVQATTRDTELVEVLRDIQRLVGIVHAKIETTTNSKDIEKLRHFEMNKTLSHSVELEWQNVRMGIRMLVLKMRDYATTLFGTITTRDDYQELQIGTYPRPHYLIGRFRTGLFESNMLPAWETTVEDPREELSSQKGFSSYGDDGAIGWFLRSSIVGKDADIKHLSAEGLTPLMLIQQFRDSLRSALEQQGLL